jgi:homoserine kinase type II
MAVYTDIDAETLAEALSAYDIGPAVSFKGIAEGVSNSNFLLETACGRYILTVFEKRVVADDLPFFVGLMSHLAAKGFPAPSPIPARDGVVLRRIRDKPAMIVSFLNGISPSRPSPSQCRALGQGLARLHAALSDFGMHRANDLSLSSWPDLFAGRADEADRLSPGLGAQIADDLAELRKGWPSSLPSGPIHADLFPDNAFFIGADLSGVIDYYFACTDFLVYDIAVCLNAWAFESRGEFNITKGRALIGGYESVRPLSGEEKEALPILARGAAMRFFLTRLVDWASTPGDALVRPKNPLDYSDRLGFHRQARGYSDYAG